MPNSEQSFIYLDIKKVCEPLISFKQIMLAKLHSSGLNKAGGSTEKSTIVGHDFFTSGMKAVLAGPRKPFLCLFIDALTYSRARYTVLTIRVRARNEEDPWEKRLARKDTIEV